MELLDVSSRRDNIKDSGVLSINFPLTHFILHIDIKWSSFPLPQMNKNRLAKVIWKPDSQDFFFVVEKAAFQPEPISDRLKNPFHSAFCSFVQSELRLEDNVLPVWH